MSLTDETTAPRPGEELDAERLTAWMAGQGFPGALRVRQFPGGKSNLTYLVEQGEHRYVLRRPPFGTKAKSAHDMAREFRVLSALKPHFPYAPRALAYGEDESVMGCPFYLMEKLDGIILRRELPEGLSLKPEAARRLGENLLDVQVRLHAIDVQAAGLVELGKAEGYVHRQIAGWSERYRAAHTDDVPDGETVMAWLAAHEPADSPRAVLIHNDYKFDNVLLNPDTLEISGVLDWEMATLGDPLMDLGASLAYWVEAGDGPELLAIRQLPTHLPGMPKRAELVARYAEKSGLAIADFRFYYAYGLFRLAGIAQQIYFRYRQGQTKDPRFAQFGQFVRVLLAHAEKCVTS